MMLIKAVRARQRQHQISHACQGRAEVRHRGCGLHVLPVRRVQQRAAQQRVWRPVHAGDTQHFWSTSPQLSCPFAAVQPECSYLTSISQSSNQAPPVPSIGGACSGRPQDQILRGYRATITCRRSPGRCPRARSPAARPTHLAAGEPHGDEVGAHSVFSRIAHHQFCRGGQPSAQYPAETSG